MTTTEPIIWYVELKGFWDNTPSKWKQTTVKDYIEKINHLNMKTSFAEVLSQDFVRPYFDIDHLEGNYKIKNVIEALKKAFLTYFNFVGNDLKVTITKNTSKESYHIFFDGLKVKIYVRKKDLKEFVKDFSKHYCVKVGKSKKKKGIVDQQVYGVKQLFRSVNQPKPKSNDKMESINTIHALIQGNIEDTIIQNFNIYKDILLEPIISFD